MPADNPLAGQWYYSVGRTNDTPDDAAGYVFRTLPSLSSLDRYHPERKGVLWIRQDFRVPASLENKQLSMILGFINPADITYVNGHEIGRTGIAPYDGGHFFSDWNSYRKYDMDTGVLREGTNTLLVKLYANYEGSIEGKIALGQRETIGRIYAAENFLRTDINAIIASIMFIIGLYHLLIYARRPQDRENLYYSLLCICFALYQTNFFMTKIPLGIHYVIPYIAHQKLILTALYLSSAFGILFINAYLKLKVPKAATAGILLFFGAAAVAVIAAPDYRLISLYSKIVNAAVTMPTMLYVITAIIVMAVRKNRSARVMILGFAPLAACAVFDVIIHNILKMEYYLYLSGFGFSAFLISIMFILANDFVTYHNEVEDLNITLDNKVEKRTEELLTSKEETEKAMVEIEKAHSNQKSLNRELSQAHDRMKRDMDLAANVQFSFFPKRAPETPEWDTAFVFKPMSGVSGDLYDFFLMGEKLYGAALFDVSGHGIASGLITMIVKSVLYRNFTRNRELMLNQLLQRMNRELIQEMGSVDNYITGILLRFIDGKVEYVNAGHTDLIMKNGTTGEARIVAPRNESFRGHFLGVDSMNEVYSMLRFPVQSGDSLLLYTDCLVESRNTAGEQYGVKRIQEVYTGISPGKTAEEQLNAITADLYRFTGMSGLKDDLTAIVLKRTG